MQIKTLTVGAFAVNCYLLIDPKTSEAIFIDPGMEADHLIETVENLNVDLKYIINTHCHIDHAAEVKTIQDHFKIPFYIHEAEFPLLQSLPQQGAMFGIPVSEIAQVTSFVADNEGIEFGRIKGKILHTPGHSPGGISILFADRIFVGDCLFYDSIGRTDLYKGNYEQLIESIKTKLMILPDNTEVYSGHGPVTTIGRERIQNPFLQE